MSDREKALALLRRFGTDAVSFLALESERRIWFDDAAGGAAQACVAYVDTGQVWVAGGLPVAEPSRVADVAAAFLRAARSRGRSACFFCAEQSEVPGFRSLLLGEQPSWRPSEWASDLSHHRSVREQIRRATAKGVRIRAIAGAELRAGSSTQAQMDDLARDWLASRAMEPMSFLVALEPFHFPEEHRYFVAERGGRIVAFLSAVPIYAAGGWLVEDIVRGRSAPNGTTEALLAAMMGSVTTSRFVTLGLAPLAGPVSPWLRVVRLLTRPLYDFQGIYAFKRRLRPEEWRPVWLLFPDPEHAWTHVTASLRAFAGGPLYAFAARSIARHPSGPPWALALPLVAWTVVLGTLAALGRSDLLGFSRVALFAWVAFDGLLATLLLRAALRPKPKRLAYSTTAAGVDAVCSVVHLWRTGLGATFARFALRGLATFAPCVGVTVLAWATAQAVARARR